MDKLNPYHFLMGCRVDNLFRLLKDNRSELDPARLGEVALIAATGLLTAPFGAAEKLLYSGRIERTQIETDPLFILGHWRSGTTYLQNMLSRDTQFGWFDPVDTALAPCSLTAGRFLVGSVAKGIANGRPMDNVQYSLNLPMEDALAILTLSDHALFHLIVFPESYDKYLSGCFVEELPPEELAKWQKTYDYLLRKLTYVWEGRQLVLKSPDNTARVGLLREMYPDARFVNIHRDPYRTITSTVRMFLTQTEIQRLSKKPENLEEIVEDVVVGIFSKMYRNFFAQQPHIPANRFSEIAYTEFCADPVGSLRRIYEELEQPGFESAEPAFRDFADSQKSYTKNAFTITPRLCRKINEHLGFYFEHYGYEMREV